MYVLRQDKATGLWESDMPESYHYGFFQWAWKRLTGWRDSYGRKAQMLTQ